MRVPHREPAFLEVGFRRPRQKDGLSVFESGSGNVEIATFGLTLADLVANSLRLDDLAPITKSNKNVSMRSPNRCQD